MKFSTLLASSHIHICIIYSISQFKFYYLFGFDFYFSPVTTTSKNQIKVINKNSKQITRLETKSPKTCVFCEDIKEKIKEIT